MYNKDNILHRGKKTACHIWSIIVMIGAIILLIFGIILLVYKNNVGSCENTNGNDDDCYDKDKNECTNRSTCTWNKASSSSVVVGGSLLIVFSVLFFIWSRYLWKIKNPSDFLGGICMLADFGTFV